MEENSTQGSIKHSLPGKSQSPSTPSASASTVPEGDGTNAFVLVLSAVMAVFLVLLILLVSVIAIMLILRQRSKLKAETTSSKYACYVATSVLSIADAFTSCYAGPVQGATNASSEKM